MERVFISSVARGELASIRQAAREAVESLDVRPVMFETEPPVGDDSRRALLDRVAACDALLILLGGEYGDTGVRGVSPTEDEFNEARDRGIEVLALVHKVFADTQPANSLGMPMSMPPVVIAPDQPLMVRRGDLASDR